MLIAGGALVLLAVYFVLSERKLARGKEALLAEQHAAKVTVGAEWLKLSGELEQMTIAAADAYAGDFIDPAARTWDIREGTGLYLRARVDDVHDAARVHKAAADSVRDGFTACFFRQRETVPSNSALRDVADAGALLEQPWNVHQAYDATRVLEEPWEREVGAAGDDLRLRAFVHAYEHAKKIELPLAVDIVKRSTFFAVVLDEESDAKKSASAATPLDDLELVPHPVRVTFVDLRTKKVMVRLRRTATGEVRAVGEGAAISEEAKRAMTRQVNNCQLAEDVRSAVYGDATRDGG
jgi:hypothetical protein